MDRDLNLEFKDTETRKYAYGFDYLMHEYMLRTFAQHQTYGKALELGCFEGEFTKRLTNIYESVTVVEGSSELVLKAKEKVDDKVIFHHSRFEDFCPETPFDDIYLLHTLEHLDNPVSVLRRISSWLSEKGKLFLAVPNANAASRQIAVAMGLIDHPTSVTPGESQHGHRRTYDLATLTTDIEKAGLSVHDSGGVLFKPLANYQFDMALEAGIVDDAYLEGCYKLGVAYPELCASLYVVCTGA